MEGAQENKRLPSPPPSPPPQPKVDAYYDRFCSWFSMTPPLALALLYLTFSVAVSAYRSRGDPPTLAFVLFCYLVLLSLFVVLRRFEQLGADESPEKKTKLKAAVWLLSTALILGFSWRVSDIMPWGLAVVIWAMTGCVVGGGFFVLFLYKERDT